MRVHKIGRQYIIPNNNNFYPSVTEILNGGVSHDFKSSATNRGVNIHKKLELLFSNEKNIMHEMYGYFNDGFCFVEEKIAPYLISVFDLILSKSLVLENFSIDKIKFECEQSFFNENLGFKGTIDLICYYDNKVLFLMDFKTGFAFSKTYNTQLGGYSLLLKNEGIEYAYDAYINFNGELSKVDLELYEPLFLKYLENFNSAAMQEKKEILENNDNIDTLCNTLSDLILQQKNLENTIDILKNDIKLLIGENSYKNEKIKITFKSSFERESISDDGLTYLKLNHPQYLKKTQIKPSYVFSLLNSKEIE